MQSLLTTVQALAVLAVLASGCAAPAVDVTTGPSATDSTPGDPDPTAFPSPAPTAAPPAVPTTPPADETAATPQPQPAGQSDAIELDTRRIIAMVRAFAEEHPLRDGLAELPGCPVLDTTALAEVLGGIEGWTATWDPTTQMQAANGIPYSLSAEHLVVCAGPAEDPGLILTVTEGQFESVADLQAAAEQSGGTDIVPIAVAGLGPADTYQRGSPGTSQLLGFLRDELHVQVIVPLDDGDEMADLAVARQLLPEILVLLDAAASDFTPVAATQPAPIDMDVVRLRLEEVLADAEAPSVDEPDFPGCPLVDEAVVRDWAQIRGPQVRWLPREIFAGRESVTCSIRGAERSFSLEVSATPDDDLDELRFFLGQITDEDLEEFFDPTATAQGLPDEAVYLLTEAAGFSAGLLSDGVELTISISGSDTTAQMALDLLPEVVAALRG